MPSQPEATALRCLLDVNVLIALLDTNHLFHAKVHGWLSNHTGGLATCAITQNGAVRIMSQPRYSALISLSATHIQKQLHQSLAAQDHAFWHCDISLLDERWFDWTCIHGPGQLTDIYLLGIALANQGCLVTLDRHISVNTVRGAQAVNLLIL
jgi:uncharacterized protein